MRQVVLVLALLVAACNGAPDPDPTPTPAPTPTPVDEDPTPTPTPTPTPDDPAAWSECTNPVQGYTVAYPADWTTNEGMIDELGPCSLFDPDPEQIRVQGMEIPLDIAVNLGVEAVEFAQTEPAAEFEEVLDRRETTISGREAVRLELEATGEAALDRGTLTTYWRLDLGDRTFFATSHDVGEPDYAEKQRVLDEMVQTVRFDD